MGGINHNSIQSDRKHAARGHLTMPVLRSKACGPRPIIHARIAFKTSQDQNESPPTSWLSCVPIQTVSKESQPNETNQDQNESPPIGCIAFKNQTVST
jgi:hypothetical protein